MHERHARACGAVLALAASLALTTRGDARETADPGVLISRQLATAHHLRIGDTIRLASTPSGAGARAFRILGVYEPEPDPMRFAQPRLEARLHLSDLTALGADEAGPATRDAIGAINVALRDPSEAAAFARQVSARLPGITARLVTAPDERTATFLVIDRFHLAIAIVSVTGSAIFLLALMVMLVDERRETVGVLRLIGFTRRRILLQIVAEGALIALAGTVFGVLFALATEGAFNRFFQWRYDTSLVFLRVTAPIVLQSVLFALPLGIVASLIASWTFVRRRLLDLVRR